MKRLLLACSILSAASCAHGGILINEIRPNPEGTDPSDQLVELLGTAGDSFDVWLLSLESDGFKGNVDRSFSLSGTFDSEGLASICIGDLENPSFTLVLTDAFDGSSIDDLDSDDDGTPETPGGLGNILDAIGVPDSTAHASTLYGSSLGGLDFAYTGDEPQLIFRDSITLDWYAINDPAGSSAFALDGSEILFSEFSSDPSVATFGSVNPTITTSAIPEPSTAIGMITMLGFAVLLVRRRD